VADARETFRRKSAEAGQMPLFVPEGKWTPPQAMPQLKNRGIKRLAIDFETKDPGLLEHGIGIRRGSHAIGLAVGTDDCHRWYFPVAHEGGGNLDLGLVKRWAKSELNAFEGEVCGAHLAYDLDYAAEWGVLFPHAKAFHDVQIVEPLLDENRMEYNLDALSMDYLGEGKVEKELMEAASAWGFSTPRSAKSNLWRLPSHAVGPYAEGDVDRPLRILDLQLPRIEAEGLSDIYNVERKLIPILVAMRRRGVRVDVRAAEALRDRFVKERAVWAKELKRIAGPKAELTEPLSFYKALEERGVPVPRTAKTGQPSVTKPLLERYADNELVKVVLNGRKLNTLITTFMDSQILGYTINGRLHPTWNQLKGDNDGTIARIAGATPNMTFIPSRDADWQEEELAPLVRGVFVPEEGEKWQRDDYSQIEYRFLVHFARGRGAEAARELYRRKPDTDFHKMAMQMLKVDPEDKKKRKKIKITNFAKVYGAQAFKLSIQMGCSVEEAEDFVKEYNRELPFVEETMNEAQKWAQRRGYVVTVMNRRRRYPFWGPKGYKKDSGLKVFRSYDEAVKAYGPRVERVGCFTALNGKMQGSSADLIKKAMVDGHEAGVTAKDALGPYLLTIYDELDTSVPPTKKGDEAGKELSRIMENAIKLSVPVLVETDRGDNWGECK
jgi:DNA polymerase-1